MCSDGWHFDDDEVDGECPDCGTPTCEGQAQYGCARAEVTCETCGYAMCDGGC